VPCELDEISVMMHRSNSPRGARLLGRTTLFAATAAVASLLVLRVSAQIPAVKFDVQAAKGLEVSPLYEGWWEVDGTKYVLFGVSNRNLEEIVDVPIGPDNHIAPGPADQGQPTHFVPGISYGVFAVAVPKDQPAEVTWTLKANGKTLSIPSSLDPLYLISPQRENGTAYTGNTPPVVRFDPAGPSAQGPRGIVVSRSATASRPLALDVWVADDGLPSGDRGVTGNRRGVALSWQVYRGAAAVHFSERRPAVEQGKARTTVTFSEPGVYMLQLQATDSRSINRCCWTNAYVAVTVDRRTERQ
jgi:hypothetical protein